MFVGSLHWSNHSCVSYVSSLSIVLCVRVIGCLEEVGCYRIGFSNETSVRDDDEMCLVMVGFHFFYTLSLLGFVVPSDLVEYILAFLQAVSGGFEL